MTSRHLEFDRLPNTRDLGGMTAYGGRTIMPGRLVRSGQLFDITSSDSEKLSDLVDTVVDFRTEQEKAENPDTMVPGTRYHFIPVIDSFSSGVSREAGSDEDIIGKLVFDPEASRQYMCSMYRRFVESDFSVSQYSKFFRILMEDHDKAVLWHCSVGKDRAGIASMLIEKILGVPEQDILEDYLATNMYVKDELQKVTAYAHQKSGSDDPVIDRSMAYIFGTDRSYIETFFNVADSRFGSFDAFVRDGLGLSDDDVNLLRKKYLS